MGQIDITVNEEFIEVESYGKKDYQHAVDKWSEIKNVGEREQIFKILGVSISDEPISINDSFEHTNIVREAGLNDTYKIAWVELNKAHFERYRFTEQTMHQNGINFIQLFETREEAMQWLLND